MGLFKDAPEDLEMAETCHGGHVERGRIRRIDEFQRIRARAAVEAGALEIERPDSISLVFGGAGPVRSHDR